MPAVRKITRTIPRSPKAQKEEPALDMGKKFDLILGADFHLTANPPRCREPEEFLMAQTSKLRFVRRLCELNDCPLALAGDTFDVWNPPHALVNMVLDEMPKQIICVPGQHDLKFHNLESLPETALGTLAASGRAVILHGGARWFSTPGVNMFEIHGLGFGEEVPDGGFPGLVNDLVPKVLLWHKLVCDGKQPFPGAEAPGPRALFKALPEFNVILTGDNHQQFMVQAADETWLVNPGNLTRSAVDQDTHHPAVYGWRIRSNEMVRIQLPHDKNVLIDERPEETKEVREARMEAYIKMAKDDSTDSRVSFHKSLRSQMKIRKTSASVEKIVWEAVGRAESL